MKNLGILMGVILLGQSIYSEDLGASFRNYLSTMPDIQHLLYVRPAEFMSAGGKPLDGLLTYDLAIQGNSFYFRNLTNYPEHPANFKGGEITGLTTSTQYWKIDWYIAQGRVTTSPKSVPQSTTVTPSDSAGAAAEQEISLIRSLGLGFILPGSLVWIDESRFTARTRSSSWPTDPADYPLEGQIISKDPAGRPLKMQVKSPSFPSAMKEVDVKYVYGLADPAWFPATITIAANVLKIGTVEQSRQIQSVHIGTDPRLGPAGYLPTLFLSEKALSLKPMLLVKSNNVQYVVDDRGLQQVWVAPPPNRSILNLGTLIIGLAVLVPLFGWGLRTYLRAK